MNKKILTIFSIVVLSTLILPSFVLGAVVYERTPSGFTIENPVSFNLNATYEEFKTYCNNIDFSFWGVRIEDNDDFEPTITYSELVASSTLDYTFEMNLPVSEYKVVAYVCYDEGLEYLNDVSVEYTGEVIFEVVEGEPEIPVGPIKAGFDEHVPATAIASTTAYIGDLVLSSGPFLWLAMGIPLAFFVIRKILDLINPDKVKVRK